MATPVSLPAILFVAAEPREFSGLMGFCTIVRKLPWAVDWARAVELNGRRVILAANGAGAARAARAVQVVRSQETVQAVVSTGFCGALESSLEIGTIFVASIIESPEGSVPALPPAAKEPYVSGRLVSIDHVAQTAQEKRALRGRGASAVEMEAGGVAGEAARNSLDFYCVRAVTDLAEESFSNDFNAVLRADGHFATIDLLASAICRPRTRLPELFRLRRRCRVAAHTLGEFLANCRF